MRESVNVSLAVFLRGDIYSHVVKFAREPDKINVLAIDWNQEELPLRIIEERYLAVRPDGTQPEELWEKFFCPTVRRIETRRYILGRILHRPRDIITLCNAAILHAVNGRRSRIEEEDVLPQKSRIADSRLMRFLSKMESRLNSLRRFFSSSWLRRLPSLAKKRLHSSGEFGLIGRRPRCSTT